MSFIRLVETDEVRFKRLVNEPDYYVALIEPPNMTTRRAILDLTYGSSRSSEIHRYHNIEKSLKNFLLKKVDERIQLEVKKIHELEQEIVKGTTESIMEDTSLPDNKKKHFFSKLFNSKE